METPSSARPPCISVVTPVYNAQRYLRRAVESALAQPAVAEVILAEDGSPDGSLRECEALAVAESRVRLVRHPGGANRGAGETRNLALANATQPLVAFLDADDFYLPGRFDTALAVLQDAAVDGVYEAATVEYATPADRERFLAVHGESVDAAGFTTIVPGIAPEALCESLICRGAGFCHLDGLVVRRELLARAGGFPEIRLHQDVHFLVRLAYHGRLLPGSLERPVAVRWAHGENRISRATRVVSVPFRRRLWRGLLAQALDEGWPPRLLRALVWRNYWDTHALSGPMAWGRRIGISGIGRAAWFVRELATRPGLTLRWMARLARAGTWSPLPRLPEVLR